MKLTDRIAIVTGSSSGVGRGIALGLAREGATVVINCSQNLAGASAVAAEIEQLGCQWRIVQSDVGSKADVQALMDQTRAAFGKLNILANMAKGTDAGSARRFAVRSCLPWRREGDTSTTRITRCRRRWASGATAICSTWCGGVKPHG